MKRITLLLVSIVSFAFVLQAQGDYGMYAYLYKDCVERVFKRNNIYFPKYFPHISLYKKQYFRSVLRSLLPQCLLKYKLNNFDELGDWVMAKDLCDGFINARSRAKKPFSINSVLSEWYIGTVVKLLKKQ